MKGVGRKTQTSEPAVMGRTTPDCMQDFQAQADLRRQCSHSPTHLTPPKGYQPGVGLPYAAPWLPLCQVGFRQVRHTCGQEHPHMHRPLGFLPQEAGEHGAANVSMFPQKPLLLSSDEKGASDPRLA